MTATSCVGFGSAFWCSQGQNLTTQSFNLCPTVVFLILISVKALIINIILFRKVLYLRWSILITSRPQTMNWQSEPSTYRPVPGQMQSFALLWKLVELWHILHLLIIFLNHDHDHNFLLYGICRFVQNNFPTALVYLLILDFINQNFCSLGFEFHSCYNLLFKS